MLKGMESAERFNLILSLTSIRSESQKEALFDYFVKGFCFSTCAAVAGITESNFQRAIDNVQSKDLIVEQIKEIDWARFKSEK